MRKILYYSPLFPIVGLVVHFLWIVFYYEIITVDAKTPMWATFTIMAYNGFVAAVVIDSLQ